MGRQMAQFGWLSAGPIPAEYDLRRCDWELVRADDPAPLGEVISDPSGHAGSAARPAVPMLLADQAIAAALRTRSERAGIALVGIDDPITRAHFLMLGFGEVLPREVSLDELAARMGRVAAALAALPRRRGHGRLHLDLLAREGYVGERRLALHPREFALLWRLAEAPGEPVAPSALLSEVWQLNFRPETNSLAVHVCRLRAKLAVAGLPQIIRTTPDGAYVLTAGQNGPAPDPAAPRSAIPMGIDHGGLDDHVRMVEPLAPAQ